MSWAGEARGRANAKTNAMSTSHAAPKIFFRRLERFEFSFTVRPPRKIRIWGDVECKGPAQRVELAPPKSPRAESSLIGHSLHHSTTAGTAPNHLLKRVNSAFKG